MESSKVVLPDFLKPDMWSEVTAFEDEQEFLKIMFKNGAAIEAKGRDTLHVGYEWGDCSFPLWDFKNNYYRVKQQ